MATGPAYPWLDPWERLPSAEVEELNRPLGKTAGQLRRRQRGALPRTLAAAPPTAPPTQPPPEAAAAPNYSLEEVPMEAAPVQAPSAAASAPEGSPGYRDRLLKKYFSLMEQQPQRTEFPQMYTPEMVEGNYNRMAQERTLGQMLLATGNRSLSPLGKTLASSDPSAYLDSLAQQEQVRRYQQWQVDRGADTRIDEMNTVVDLMGELESANGSEPWFKMTAGERDRLLEDRATYQNMVQALGQFDPDFAQIGSFKIGEVESGVPYARSMANWLAGRGIGTQNSKEAQMWWANWDRIYTLGERNELFGATLTQTEKDAWAAANINAEMTPDQIQKNVSTILGIMHKKWQEATGLYGASNLGGHPVLGSLDLPGSGYNESVAQELTGIRKLDHRSQGNRKRLKVTPNG